MAGQTRGQGSRLSSSLPGESEGRRLSTSGLGSFLDEFSREGKKSSIAVGSRSGPPEEGYKEVPFVRVGTWIWATLGACFLARSSNPRSSQRAMAKRSTVRKRPLEKTWQLGACLALGPMTPVPLNEKRVHSSCCLLPPETSIDNADEMH